MRSAYLVLGVPGNASSEDIEEAFAKAQQFYTRERLAAQDGAVDRFNEVRDAYRVLRDPAARSAHDRKLALGSVPPPTPAAAVRIRARDDDESAFTSNRLIKLMAVVAVLLFAAGMALSYRNGEIRKEQQAQELAEKRKAEQDEARQRAEAREADARREAEKVKAEAAERRFAVESQHAAARAAAESRSREAAAASAHRASLAEAQRQEAMRLNEERRRAMEARQRVEQDKRRIRELCYQQYRRPDC